MASKSVLDRQRVGEAILATARTHAQEVGERLHQILAADLTDGEPPVDFTRLQLLLARHLERQLDTLVEAEEAHLQELDDDPEERLRRDEVCEEVRARIAEIRRAARGVFGTEQARVLLGVEGDTPRSPILLHRYAVRLLQRLREPITAEPVASQVSGVEFYMPKVAAALEPQVDRLDEALKAVGREEREAESTRGRRDEVIERFDQAVGGVARTLRGWCLLAGLPEFASRIRLTPPKRRAVSDNRGKEL